MAFIVFIFESNIMAKSTYQQQKKGKLKYNANRVSVSLSREVRERLRNIQEQRNFTIDETLIFLLELHYRGKS